MACRYLTISHKRLPMEMGAGMYPRFVEMPACHLKRLNRPDTAVVGEAGNCQQAQEDEPCWWWQKEYPGVPDPYFEK
jgi:hypothetical protein